MSILGLSLAAGLRGPCEAPGRETEVGVSSRENPSSPYWTYRMEVSPTGQGPPRSSPTERPRRTSPHAGEPPLQTLELQRQSLEINVSSSSSPASPRRSAGSNACAADRRDRTLAERPRVGARPLQGVAHPASNRFTRPALGELANYVAENHENLVEGDFALTDFVDRFGPRLARPEHDPRGPQATRGGRPQDGFTEGGEPGRRRGRFTRS